MNARPVVAIVDYGIGNLMSVRRAVEAVGADARLVADAAQIAAAERLILPGVGAFGDCMATLAAHGLVDAVRAHAAAEKPLLGICVGMQMLFDVGEEFGETPGLGLFPGRVAAIPTTAPNGASVKVPHIGWSALLPPRGRADAWNDTPLAAVPSGTAAYFLHSFAACVANPDHVLAECDFGGRRVTAAVRRGTLLGCQFHPEKSGPAGLRILAGFARAGLSTTEFRP